MYVDQGWSVPLETLDRLRSVARSTAFQPGGGSQILPIGETTVGHLTGKGMLIALYPSQQLVAHCDPPIVGKRYHVPLMVNDGCWSFHDGEWRQLDVGQVYEMDPTVVHGAVNWGTDVRVHLMVDVEGEWRSTK